MKNLLKKIYLKKDIETIDKKICMLGNTKYDAITFITFRMFSTILFAIFLIVFTNISYAFIPIFVILFYIIYYHVFITQKLRKREAKLDREALYFFEVLTLTLESGKNLQNS